ncbi:MAG TPA: hypothetical protein VN782_13820 [Usitatibacter sp.]|nr:hypothetical protein [Usitatibacter sp.]
MKPISAELALGMSLALETSEAEITRARLLLAERLDPADALISADRLLERARARIQTVRLALDDGAASASD